MVPGDGSQSFPFSKWVMTTKWWATLPCIQKNKNPAPTCSPADAHYGFLASQVTTDLRGNNRGGQGNCATLKVTQQNIATRNKINCVSEQNRDVMRISVITLFFFQGFSIALGFYVHFCPIFNLISMKGTWWYCTSSDNPILDSSLCITASSRGRPQTWKYCKALRGKVWDAISLFAPLCLWGARGRSAPQFIQLSEQRRAFRTSKQLI